MRMKMSNRPLTIDVEDSYRVQAAADELSAIRFELHGSSLNELHIISFRHERICLDRLRVWIINIEEPNRMVLNRYNHMHSIGLLGVKPGGGSEGSDGRGCFINAHVNGGRWLIALIL